MNEELSLKLQAYADGELSGREAREVAALIAKDADARALLTELVNTRTALADFEADLKLPESREFYWSKIERELRRLERTQTPRSASPWAVWRRFLSPVGALVVLAVAGVLVFSQLQRSSAAESAASEFTLPDTATFTYHDYANGTTLVWLPYPAENEFAESDTEDTLD
jgi:anti-sigma-K factor RskA